MTAPHANPEDFDLYALGALDGEDLQTFEAHVRSCVHCQQQLAVARAQVALLGMTVDPIVPPASLKANLLQKAREVHPTGMKQTTTTSATSAAPRRRHWGLRFSLAFAAAAIILGFITAWLWKQNQMHEQVIGNMQAELQQAQQQTQKDNLTMHAMAQVVGAPDTIQVTLLQQPSGPPGQAHVLYNARTGTLVYSGEVSPAPGGKSYQLWLVPANGAPVSAGLVGANQQNGAIVVQLQQGISPKAFAVTVEPQGGSPQPTGPKVLVGAVNS